MTPQEFKDIRLKAGMSVSQLAFVSNSHPRTIRRWEAGERTVPGPMTTVMSCVKEGLWSDPCNSCGAMVYRENLSTYTFTSFGEDFTYELCKECKNDKD